MVDRVSKNWRIRMARRRGRNECAGVARERELDRENEITQSFQFRSVDTGDVFDGEFESVVWRENPPPPASLRPADELQFRAVLGRRGELVGHRQGHADRVEGAGFEVQGVAKRIACEDLTIFGDKTDGEDD